MKTLALCLAATALCEVLQVIEVCRHGARAPTKLFQWDSANWPYGPGELTPFGMRQHFLLGSELRQRYVIDTPLLQPSYDASMVYFRSTDVNRTIMSAQSQLMGLFANSGPTVSNSLQFVAVPPIDVLNQDDIINGLQHKALPNQFQAFPVHVVPAQDDLVLQANNACNALVANIKAQRTSLAYNETITKNSDFWTALQTATNLPNSTLFPAFSSVLDDLLIDHMAGYNQLNLSPEFFQNATELFNEVFALPYESDLNARLFSAGFFLELLQEISYVTNEQPYAHFRLYSAHDTTIAGFLAGLEQFQDKVQPPFASSLIFQISNNSNYVLTMRVTYNDLPLLIPTCPSVDCPLDVFTEFLELRGFDDLSQACQLDPGTVGLGDMTEATPGASPTPKKGSSNLKWVAWVAVALAAVVLIAGVALCFLGKGAGSSVGQPEALDPMGASSSSVGEKKVINREKFLV